MARGYFSRLARGGDGPALLPSRPVSNLWKAARIDATSAGAEPEAAENRGEGAPAVRGQRLAVAVGLGPEAQFGPIVRGPRNIHKAPPALPIAVAPGTESRVAEARTISKTTTSRPRKSPTAASPAHEIPPVAVSPSARPALDASRAAVRVESAATRTEVAPLPSPSPQPSQRRERTAVEPARRPEAVSSPAAEPAALRLRVRSSEATANRVDNSKPGQLPVQEARPLLASEQAAAQIAVPPMPTASISHRPAAVTARPASRQEEEPEAQTNSVHIGKIEVQVVSPPAPVHHPAPPPPQPKGRLARGYVLWPGQL
jgi:hypothetical protein